MMRIALMGLGLASCIIPAQPAGGGNGGYQGGAYNGGQSSGDPYAGSPSANSAGGGAPAPAGPVSVDIHSDCPHEVKVFYGDKPKFGSGTYSSIESNSIENHSFNPGEMMWIVDDEENGVASVSVGPGMHGIEIPAGCTSLIAQ